MSSCKPKNEFVNLWCTRIIKCRCENRNQYFFSAFKALVNFSMKDWFFNFKSLPPQNWKQLSFSKQGPETTRTCILGTSSVLSPSDIDTHRRARWSVGKTAGTSPQKTTHFKNAPKFSQRLTDETTPFRCTWQSRHLRDPVFPRNLLFEIHLAKGIGREAAGLRQC